MYVTPTSFLIRTSLIPTTLNDVHGQAETISLNIIGGISKILCGYLISDLLYPVSFFESNSERRAKVERR